MTFLQNLQVPGLDEFSLSRQQGFAIVIVTAEVPNTAGLGDDIDISLTSAFDAESLAGGRLDYAILKPPGFTNSDAPVLATVIGAPIPSTLPNPVRATLLDAGRIEVIRRLKERDIFMLDKEGGSVCFLLRLVEPWSSSGVAAREIADAINEDFAYEDASLQLATLREDGRVLVRFPVEVDDVDERIRFLSMIEQIRIDDRLITANSNAIFLDRPRGVVVVGSGVRFMPTAVSVQGLEHVTILPTPEPTQFDPLIRSDTSVGLSTSLNASSSAHLQELVEQMRKLQVPVDKQIDVIIGLRRSGSLLNVDIWKLEE
jgi:flagellar basal body P-ring protein FlgI